MNYKIGFYILLIFICLVLFPSLHTIHKKLDSFDRYVVGDQITKYKEAGWLPYEKTERR